MNLGLSLIGLSVDLHRMVSEPKKPLFGTFTG